MALIQFHGPNYGTADFYTAPTTNVPKMFANLWWDITRSSERDPYINIQFSGEIFRLAGNYGNSSDPVTGNYGPNCSHSSWISYYGYYINIYLSANGVERLVATKNSSPSTWTSSIGYLRPDSFNIYWPSNEPMPIVIRVLCGCYNSSSCPAGNYDREITTAGVPYYNPYTAPAIWLNPNDYTTIGILNTTDYWQHYSVSKGSNNIVGTKAELWNDDASGSWKWGQDYNRTESNPGYWDSYRLTSANGFSDGARYRMSVSVHDDTNNWIYSPGKNLNTYYVYTYRNPIIRDLSLTNYNFSGIGNSTMAWYTNARKWNTNLENNFETYFMVGTGSNKLSTNSNPVQSESNETYYQTYALNKSIIDNIFTAVQRSNDTISTNIHMIRYSKSSNLSAVSNYQNITIQFKPKYAPSRMTFTNSATNATITAGSTVYVYDVPNIRVDWVYPSEVDRGVINGYKVRIYADNNKTILTKEYTINTNIDTLSGNACSQLINLQNDLQRGVTNYITINAFYNKPNNSGILEGPVIQSSFVLPLGRLKTPNISYPISGATWHNKNFRILFQLPEDEDFSSYSQAIRQGDYHYKNVEVKINNKVYAFVGGTGDMSSDAIVTPNIFSTVDLTYAKRICINPSLNVNLEDANVYNIQIRVQKNYYTSSWSAWSQTVTLNKTGISRLALNAQDIVLISHYAAMRNGSKRLYDTYPINILDTNNVGKTAGDTILAINYQGIYNTILGIQSGVNSWALCDSTRQNVKFSQVIDMFDNPNQPTQEIITADLDASPRIDGKNYINILIDCMNKLY